MRFKPDITSVLAISIALIAFAIIAASLAAGIQGRRFSATETTVGLPMAGPPAQPPAPQTKSAEVEVDLMDRWWQSTHAHPHPKRSRSVATKHPKPDTRAAEESWGPAPGARIPPADPPRYLNDTSRWPVHGPATAERKTR